MLPWNKGSFMKQYLSTLHVLHPYPTLKKSKNSRIRSTDLIWMPHNPSLRMAQSVFPRNLVLRDPGREDVTRTPLVCVYIHIHDIWYLLLTCYILCRDVNCACIMLTILAPLHWKWMQSGIAVTRDDTSVRRLQTRHLVIWNCKCSKLSSINRYQADTLYR